MQLARGFFLTPEKNREAQDHRNDDRHELESKLSKQQISRCTPTRSTWSAGSFTITGFGQAAAGLFRQDIKNLTLPEAALAGSRHSAAQLAFALPPSRSRAGAAQCRPHAMVETDAITRDDAERAKATPLKLAPPNVEASDAPLFCRLSERRLTDPRMARPSAT